MSRAVKLIESYVKVLTMLVHGNITVYNSNSQKTKLTRDDRVNPHWSMASKSKAETHVAFAHSHCPEDKFEL